jgi:hypothetical protein
MAKVVRNNAARLPVRTGTRSVVNVTLSTLVVIIGPILLGLAMAYAVLGVGEAAKLRFHRTIQRGSTAQTPRDGLARRHVHSCSSLREIPFLNDGRI